MFPEELFDRFRTVSLERTRRVEAAWNRVVQNGASDPGLVGEMLREIHTLKGDAGILGCQQVLKLCQKLEDLLELVDELDCHVSEDLELVVSMALQFLAMLLRMKRGSPVTGLDLEGFVRQVDDVTRETRTLFAQPLRARRVSGRIVTEVPFDRLTEQTRQRLAMAATSVYLEYLSARGQSSRTRLRSVWNTFRQELSRMQVAELAPLLDRHGQATRELAETLGKRVAIDIDVHGSVLEPRIAEAVDVAVLHLMRNAVDHGIETSADRTLAGKPAEGLIRVRANPAANGKLEVTVEDDGRGIDRAAVRRLAIERGLLDRSQIVEDAKLLDVVFEPGFSTRAKVTTVSGRGVGLDAVKSAIVRAGGTVQLTTTAHGTMFVLTVPAPVRHVHAYQFLAPSGQVALAVSARWTPALEDAGSDAIDPLATIQIVGASRQTSVPAPPTPRELCVRLRWGFLEVPLRVATEPRLVIADRICPTGDDHPLEVVSIDGQETLLLRPEHVGELTAMWNARTAAAGA